MTTNVFLVQCPDCMAPAGQRCRVRVRDRENDDGNMVHANRRDAARLRTAVQGTCTRCGRLMLQMTDPDETRHARADDEGPIPMCPPIDLTPGFAVQEWTPSGAEQFVRSDRQPPPPEDQPNPPPPTILPLPSAAMPICPECRAGKHDNCDGKAWDDVRDEPGLCDCARSHGG